MHPFSAINSMKPLKEEFKEFYSDFTFEIEGLAVLRGERHVNLSAFSFFKDSSYFSDFYLSFYRFFQ